MLIFVQLLSMCPFEASMSSEKIHEENSNSNESLNNKNRSPQASCSYSTQNPRHKKKSTWRARLFSSSKSAQSKNKSSSSSASPKTKKLKQEKLNKEIEQDLKAAKRIFKKLSLDAKNNTYIKSLDETPLIGANKELLNDGGYFSKLVIEVNDQNIDGQFLKYDLMVNNNLKDIALLSSYLVLTHDHAKGLICNTLLLVSSTYVRWRNRAIKYIIDKVLEKALEQLSDDGKKLLHQRLIKLIEGIAGYKNSKVCGTEAIEKALGPDIIDLILASEHGEIYEYLMGLIAEANIQITYWRNKADDILTKAGEFYTNNMLAICTDKTYLNSRELAIQRNKINLDAIALTGNEETLHNAEAEIIDLCRKIIIDHTLLLEETNAKKLPQILMAFHQSKKGISLYECLSRPELRDVIEKHFAPDFLEKAKDPKTRHELIQHQSVQDTILTFEQNIKIQLLEVLRKLFPINNVDDATKKSNRTLTIRHLKAAMNDVNNANKILDIARSNSALTANDIQNIKGIISRRLPLLHTLRENYNSFMEYIKVNQAASRALPTSPSFIGSIYIQEAAADKLMKITSKHDLENLITKSNHTPLATVASSSNQSQNSYNSSSDDSSCEATIKARQSNSKKSQKKSKNITVPVLQLQAIKLENNNSSDEVNIKRYRK